MEKGELCEIYTDPDRLDIFSVGYIVSVDEDFYILKSCICHVVGYDPDMPQHVGGEYSMSSDFIKKYFKPLRLNNGICCDCEKVAKKLNK